jgi:hypothetical protein
MKAFKFAGLFLFACLLAGCPAANQQKVAQAVNNISIITAALQQGEISAHQQGLIPDGDHKFVEQQLLSLSQAGKTADACIRTAVNTAGDVACINNVVNTVDQINSQGGLYLKSDKAKTEFQTAMASIKTVLESIEITLGGQPQQAIAPVQ